MYCIVMLRLKLFTVADKQTGVPDERICVVDAWFRTQIQTISGRFILAEDEMLPESLICRKTGDLGAGKPLLGDRSESARDLTRPLVQSQSIS